MVELPENEVTQSDLETWYKLKDELKRVQAAEMLLRTKIFKGKFPNPEEGTNNYPLADGYVLKAVHVIYRTVDEPILNTLRKELEEKGIVVDDVIKWVPEVKIKNYKAMKPELKKFFEQCLTIKPGSPQMSIVLPAKNAKKKKEDVEDASDIDG